MQLSKPTVGPIVGAVSPTSARIFLRGELKLDGRSARRAHGVLRYGPRGGQLGKPIFIKLNPSFDMTAVAVLENLQAETEYDYQVGWFFADVDTQALDPSDAPEWDGAETITFTTAASDMRRARSFVVGSCRYLLRLAGGALLDERGDKVFRSILVQMGKQRRVDALLMLGDQIYADDMLFIDPDRCVDAFFARYRDAFTTEHLRALMGRVPTYMMLDDHEIEDNWPSSATMKDFLGKYPAAMQAFQTYQLSHSPLFEVRDGRIDGVPDHLWYTFRDGCADFFVTDSRTERLTTPGGRQLLGPAQLARLESWLIDGSPNIKFVATSVPFFGVSGKDNWDGFVEQRDRLLDHIFRHRVRRVVFLSGDVHASFTTRLVADADPDFQVLSVVSSAFFWPFPNLPRWNFAESGLIPSQSSNGYRIAQRSTVHEESNFTRVTCDDRRITVEVFARKGEALGDPIEHHF
jgi:alkaline phosphatase D